MIDTYESCCDLVRELLGDTDIPGGDIFTDEEQRGSFGSAWDELMAKMAADQIPLAERITYHTLGALTSILHPEQAAILDLDSLSSVWERPAGTSVTIIGATAGTGNAVNIETGSAHGLTSTSEVFVEDILGVPANGRWFASVVDSTHLLLRGSIFSGTYASGGTVTTSTERFIEVRQVGDLPQRDPDVRLAEYCWREGSLQFVGATADVQLRLEYLSDGSAPQTGSLIYDGIKNPLAYRTAAILAYKHGRGQDDAPRLDREARGPQMDGNGGLFFTYLQKQVRELQKTPLRRPVRPPDHLQHVYQIF